MNCDKVTPVKRCDCPILEGGWCDPHQIEKSAHWVHLCLTKPRYRLAWNDCRGPGQNFEVKHEEYLAKPKEFGPGTELRKALGCSKSRKMRVDYTQMNTWGIDGCREKVDEITEWMSSQMEPDAARRLIHIAITRAEQKLGR